MKSRAFPHRRPPRSAPALQPASSRSPTESSSRLLDAGFHQQAVDHNLDRCGSCACRVGSHLRDLRVRRRCAPALKPCWTSFLHLFLNSPLRPRTMGAMTITRSSGVSAITRCTICSADCRVIGRPQFGQCGTPIGGEQQAKVIVDFGDGSDGRSRAAAGCLSARSRSMGSGRRWRLHPGAPSGQEIGAHRPTGSRHSAAGPSA